MLTSELQLSRALCKCAGHVLTEGNTVLNDEELEMLVILRMNRSFMDFMRAHYNHLSKDAFGRTIVHDDEGGDDADVEMVDYAAALAALAALAATLASIAFCAARTVVREDQDDRPARPARVRLDVFASLFV